MSFNFTIQNYVKMCHLNYLFFLGKSTSLLRIVTNPLLDVILLSRFQQFSSRGQSPTHVDEEILDGLKFCLLLLCKYFLSASASVLPTGTAHLTEEERLFASAEKSDWDYLAELLFGDSCSSKFEWKSCFLSEDLPEVRVMWMNKTFLAF